MQREAQINEKDEVPEQIRATAKMGLFGFTIPAEYGPRCLRREPARV